MPIAVASHAEGGSSQSWNIPALTPAGTVAGDLLIAFTNSDVILTPGAGWTNLYNTRETSAGLRAWYSCWARLATGSGDSYLSAANGAAAVIVLRVTGHLVVTLASDIFFSSFSMAATTTPDPPSLSPGSTKAWLWLAVGYGWFNGVGVGFTAYPSGMTSQVTQGSGGSNPNNSAVASLVQSGSTYNPATFTCGALGGGANAGAITLAVTPAAPVDTAIIDAAMSGLDGNVFATSGIPVNEHAVINAAMSGLSGTVSATAFKRTYIKPPRHRIWVYNLAGVKTNVLD